MNVDFRRSDEAQPPAAQPTVFRAGVHLLSGHELADVVSIDDEHVIRRAFEGNAAEGCELLFRRYHRVLCSHAVRYVYSKEIAEDIVSEVFCRFWRTQAFKSVNSSFRLYLFRSVRNESYSYLRSEFRHVENLDDASDAIGSASFQPDQITQFEEVFNRLKALVETLPPQRRKIFLMNRFESKKYQEIADELGLSIKTVETHLAYALRQIRQGLKDYLV
jgi:RNA polymerase sigma-70 factor (family 1)